MNRILCSVLVLMLVLSLSAFSLPSTGTKEPVPAQTEKTAQEPKSEPAPGPEKIVFNDEVLEKLVREQMGKPEGDITAAEAEALENLDLSQPGGQPLPRIKDITDLKYFKNLKGLDLSYNLIEDLSPIAGLNKLEGLSFWGAESVKDFSALKGLTNMLDLTIAGMNGTRFTNSDMQSLAGMTNIEMIWLQGAKELTDISVVANFKKLYRLNVDYTGVSDISPAAGLTTLVEIDLRGSKVSDVSPLKNLVNLKKLFLKDCPVTDYSLLKDIYPNLEEKDFELK